MLFTGEIRNNNEQMMMKFYYRVGQRSIPNFEGKLKKIISLKKN